MAAWLPIIKTVVPIIAPIVQAAVPAFTKRKEYGEEKERSEENEAITAKQIEELQAAVNANNEYVKALATALEQSAKANDLALKRLRIITGLSLLLSGIAVVLAALAMV